MRKLFGLGMVLCMLAEAAFAGLPGFDSVEPVWRRDPMPRFAGWVVILLAACACACATPEAEPVDVSALASEFDVEPDALRLFLRGYEQGYEDGDYRNAGVFAGTSLGNVPGPEGWGWRQGLEDAVNGVPQRSPEELAPILRDR